MNPSPACHGGALCARLSSAFDEAAYRAEAARSNADPIPRPLALTLRVPGGLPVGRQRSGYIERLMREIEQVARLFDRDRDVLAMRFEAAPDLTLQLRDVTALIGSLERHFHFGASAQRAFSIRVNPRNVRAGDLAACALLGFHCAEIDARGHDLPSALHAIDTARRDGLRSVCLEWTVEDGSLPGELLAARPDRITCHLPGIPRDAAGLTELRSVAEALERAGYGEIGLEPWHLPCIDLPAAPRLSGLAGECRCARAEADLDVIGLGVGAVSQIHDSLCQNHADLGTWEAVLDVAGLPVWRGLTLASDDLLRREVIGRLLRTGEIAIADIEQRYAIDFNEYFARELRELDALAAGLVVRSPQSVRATSQGRLMLRIMAGCFERPGPHPPQ